MTLVSQHGQTSYGVVHYVVDSEEEMRSLRRSVSPGSTAEVIATGNEYILNNQLQWVPHLNQSGAKGITQVYIQDGHLHIVYSDGTDVDVGQVSSKVFQPSLVHDEDGRIILHWDLQDNPSATPEDIFLRLERAEWTEASSPEATGDQYSELSWGGI